MVVIENPFEAVKGLKPLVARLEKAPSRKVSYADVLVDLSKWLPSELAEAFRVAQTSGREVQPMARSLTVIIALLRGDRNSKPEMERWFTNAQLHLTEGQILYVSTVLTLSQDIVRLERIRASREEERSRRNREFAQLKGKRQERAGAALDRLEERSALLKRKLDVRLGELEQTLKMIADYMSVGGAM